MPIFPVLDAPRDFEDNELGRNVLAEHGSIEPAVPLTDSWIDVPMRTTHSSITGGIFEFGPYDLGDVEVRKLRDALNRHIAMFREVA